MDPAVPSTSIVKLASTRATNCEVYHRPRGANKPYTDPLYNPQEILNPQENPMATLDPAKPSIHDETRCVGRARGYNDTFHNIG
eukprot:1915742-Lingulodinium_polyedra.AAC.1